MMEIPEENQKKDKEIRQLQTEIANLQKKLKVKNRECQRYKEELVNNSVIERWKIGAYLHDNLAQQLTSVKILVSLLKNRLPEETDNLAVQCDEIIEIINESSRDVRNLSHDIVPMSVETEGIYQAVKYLKKQVETQYQVNCVLETDEVLQKINHREIATNLYNIAQEAIKNAAVHGSAENIKLVLIEKKNRLYLHIKDDGHGFDSDDLKKGRGISIMEYRAEEMGGIFRIKDAKQNNDYTTCVTCYLPLKKVIAD